MFKLKIRSELIHDFSGPYHTSWECAVRAARTMFAVHRGPVTIEIHKMDSYTNRGDLVAACRKELGDTDFDGALLRIA